MEMEFDDNHFVDFASKLDKWEMLAKSLKIPNSEIESIKNEGGMQLQRIKMLESWKQRCGSKATYRAMIEALLQINRTDLAESVITSVRSAGKDKTNKHISILRQANVVVPPSPSSSSETEDIPTPSTLTPSRTTVTQNVLPSRAQNGHMILTLRELEKEFYDLIVFAEVALKNNKVHLDTITRRFSMLPQSIKQQYQMDDSYSATRQRILNSTTIKELFDNLTELKHWNYMMPETLAYILQDVKIDDVHQKIEKYTSKLAMFKANTKLRDLIGISFPVPDYCIELTMITEGWEDKTISDVERSTMNILRRATYNGHNIPIEWKAVNPGSIELVFILMKPITSDFYSRMEILHDICKDSGVRIVQVDGCVLYDHQYSKDEESSREVPHKLWSTRGTIIYNAGGGRDVLILAPDLSLSHPEAVARRHGQPTEEDKLKLLSQGLPPDCHDEVAIVKARCELDMRYRIVDIKSGPSIFCKDVLKCISHLLMTTQTDGAAIFYIGAGRRGTGDCMVL